MDSAARSPRGKDAALRTAVDELLRQWQQTGLMARATAEPTTAPRPAWDVNALREMVLLDARCRAIWEHGDPNRELKPNDALSHRRASGRQQSIWCGAGSSQNRKPAKGAARPLAVVHEQRGACVDEATRVRGATSVVASACCGSTTTSVV